MIIIVDHRDIAIVGVWQSAVDYRGLFHEHAGEIEIVIDQPPDEQGETLIHELLHAVWSSRHMRPRLDEESAVTQLASGLATLLRFNPGLGDVLDNALNHGIPIVTSEDIA